MVNRRPVRLLKTLTRSFANAGMADISITELVMSPRWTATVGDIDGTLHVVLRIEHPRLGPLDFLLPGNDSIELAAALEKTWERRDEKRMGNSASPAADKAAEIEQPQAAQRSWWARIMRPNPLLTSKFIARRARGANKQATGSNKQSA